MSPEGVHSTSKLVRWRQVGKGIENTRGRLRPASPLLALDAEQLRVGVEPRDLPVHLGFCGGDALLGLHRLPCTLPVALGDETLGGIGLGLAFLVQGELGTLEGEVSLVDLFC